MEIIEEFNKDSYLEKLRKRLKQMKVERKIIENEVKHMNIHLENLKQTNNNNLNTIKKVQRKTEEKIDKLNNYLQKIKINQYLKEENKKNLEEKRKKNEKLRNSLWDKKKYEKYIEEKNNQILLSKLRNEYNKELSKYLKNIEIEKNRHKVENVKQQIFSFKENKKKKIIEKRKEIAKELEDKLIREYKIKEEFQKEKEKIENESNKLIYEVEKSGKKKRKYIEEYNQLSLDKLYYNND